MLVLISGKVMWNKALHHAGYSTKNSHTNLFVHNFVIGIVPKTVDVIVVILIHKPWFGISYIGTKTILLLITLGLSTFTW